FSWPCLLRSVAVFQRITDRFWEPYAHAYFGGSFFLKGSYYRYQEELSQNPYLRELGSFKIVD
ncbi:hypothetical protein, partial [Sphaerochaeta halotolerans]|uniref:hypothetical protein n=1 Tax=Sphaerochaeta halotolerans TaxID=2293840 RepID=UPI0019D16673